MWFDCLWLNEKIKETERKQQTGTIFVVKEAPAGWYFRRIKSWIGTEAAKDKKTHKLCYYQRHFVKTKNKKNQFRDGKPRNSSREGYSETFWFVTAKHFCPKMLSNTRNWKFVGNFSKFYFIFNNNFHVGELLLPKFRFTEKFVMVRIYSLM